MRYFFISLQIVSLYCYCFCCKDTKKSLNAVTSLYVCITRNLRICLFRCLTIATKITGAAVICILYALSEKMMSIVTSSTIWWRKTVLCAMFTLSRSQCFLHTKREALRFRIIRIPIICTKISLHFRSIQPCRTMTHGMLLKPLNSVLIL